MPHSHYSHTRTLSLDHASLDNSANPTSHYPIFSSDMFVTPSATPTSISSHRTTPNGAEHAEMINRATMNLLASTIATPTTPSEQTHHQTLAMMTHADIAQVSTQLNALRSTTASIIQQQQLAQSQPTQRFLTAAAAAAAATTTTTTTPSTNADHKASSYRHRAAPDHTAEFSSMPTLASSSLSNMMNSHLLHHQHSGCVGSIRNHGIDGHSLSIITPTKNSAPELPSSQSTDQESSTPGSTKTPYKRFRNSFIFFANEQRKIRKTQRK